jgi:enoyl-CoA hydratase/carnithine racemase
MNREAKPMVVTERAGAVLVATLSRPAVNALDGRMIAGIGGALDEALREEAITVLHIRSEQKSFCAGADLALLRACLDSAEGCEAMVDLVRQMQRLFDRIEDAPVVTLAEIGGAAMGGGLELALACDLRVAAVESILGLPEVGLGLIPGAGGTQRLTRLAGEGVAKRLILGAETIDGAEALRLGLVQWAQPRERLAEWTRALAARLADRPKAALAAAKRCIAAERDPACDGYAVEIAATQALYADAGTRRRVSEFLVRKAR